MTHTPIKPRADVGPTCRGSTGTRHNGWNPAPLLAPIRFAPVSSAPQGDSTGADNHGWNPGSSALPISSRTCGVVHAIHRIIHGRTRSPRPRRGFRHRSPRGLRRPAHQILSRSNGKRGRLRPRLREWGRGWPRGWGREFRRLGLLPASSSSRVRAARPDSPARLGTRPGSHVRSCSQGRLAPLGRSLAHPSSRRAGGDSGLLLIHRFCRRAAARNCRRHCSGRLAGVDRPAYGRIPPGRRSHRLRPLRPRFHSTLGRARRGPISFLASVLAHVHTGGSAS